MARLIDADEAVKLLRGKCVAKYSSTFLMGIFASATEIEQIPTVDAVPVVRGRWVDNGIPESMLSKCSVCGFPCGAYSFNYCPNCGADMRERSESK